MDLKIRVLSCTPATDKYISQVPFVRNTVLAFYAKDIWNRATGGWLMHSWLEVYHRSGSVTLYFTTAWCPVDAVTHPGPQHAGPGADSEGCQHQVLELPSYHNHDSKECLFYSLLCYSSRKQIKTMLRSVEYITPHFKTYEYIYFSKDGKK